MIRVHILKITPNRQHLHDYYSEQDAPSSSSAVDGDCGSIGDTEHQLPSCSQTFSRKDGAVEPLKDSIHKYLSLYCNLQLHKFELIFPCSDGYRYAANPVLRHSRAHE